MKKGRKLLLAIMVGTILCLTGCSSVPKEDQIETDIMQANSSGENILSDGEKIVSVEIKDRQTDKKQKYDHVVCTVKTEKKNISYEKEISLTYYKYDNGWAVENIAVNDEDDWIVKPLAGVDKDQIESSIISKDISVDNDSWCIESGEVSNISIKKQETDLEKGTDVVTFEIELNSAVEKATGTLKAEYEFDKEWTLKSLKAKKDMKTEDNPETALAIDENALIQALEGQRVSYGEEEKTDSKIRFYIIDSSKQQEMEIHANEISDFMIIQQSKYEKGTMVNYLCSCKLVKANVQYNLQVRYQYIYEGEWLEPVVAPEIILNEGDVEMTGSWTGSFSCAGDSGTVELNITSTDGKNYTGTYSYRSSESNGHSGSYAVSGTFDVGTMQLQLQAGEWISKPNRPLSSEKHDISATYVMYNSTLEGIGHSNSILELSK